VGLSFTPVKGDGMRCVRHVVSFLGRVQSHIAKAQRPKNRDKLGNRFKVVVFRPAHIVFHEV